MWPTEQLLLAVETVLIEARGPMKISELAKALQAMGAIWSELPAPKAEHDLYCKLWYELKRKGEDARWRRVGRGTWCHTLHLTDKLVADSQRRQPRTLDEIKREAKLDGRVKTKREITGTETCADCAHLRFYGPHIMTQLQGSCELDHVSGRPYVRACDASCHGFKHRTGAQRTSDAHERQLITIKVNGFNQSVQRKRRGED